MPKDIDEIKFMRKAFLPVLPLVYDDALSYIEFLGKVCEKCNEIIDYVNNIQETAVAEAKAYTDTKLNEVYIAFNDLSNNVDREVSSIREDNAEFKIYVTDKVNELTTEINNFYDVLRANTNAINQRTDLVIEANNQTLLNEMQTFLSGILVTNFITGTEMTVQDMFNYLCMFHLTDPITYTELAGKNCTYATLVGYDMTYTDLVTRGGAIIV